MGEGRLKRLLIEIIPAWKGSCTNASAGIFKQSVGARNRVRNRVIVSSRPARQPRLAELIPRNRFLGSLKVLKFGLWLLVGRITARNNREFEIIKNHCIK